MGRKNVKALVIGIIIMLVLIGINSIPSKNEILVNQVKESYKKKEDLTQRQINQIKLIDQNKEVLRPDEYFLLGYLNLFVEDNPTKAYDYFEKVIEENNHIEADFARTYSYKFLAQKYIQGGDIEKGMRYTEAALYSINPKNYKEYKNLINDILRPILDLSGGRILAIGFLEHMLIENYKNYDEEVELYAYRTVEQFYLLEGDYSRAIEASMSAIQLAKKLDKEFFRGKSVLNLARIEYQIGNYDRAVDIANFVEGILAEDLEWNDKLNIHRLLTLSQIEIKRENYEKALNYIIEFDKYKKHLSHEDRQDIEMMQCIIKAKLFIMQNKESLAQEELEKAYNIMEKDQIVYWPDKDIYYYQVCGLLSEKRGEYESAIGYYEKVKSMAVERKNIEGIVESLDQLRVIYHTLGDYATSEEYALEILEVKNQQRQEINENYYKYVIEKYAAKKIYEKSRKIHIINIILSMMLLISGVGGYKVYFKPRLQRRKLKKKIERYLNESKYITYYQPIVNPKGNKLVGLEALLRLKIKGQIIMPSVFLKEIEEANMTGKVSLWILNNIIEDYPIIKEKVDIAENFYISMNVSLKEIQDDSIINDMIDVLEHTSIDAKMICIEITENVGITHLDQVRRNINRLRRAGFKIAIDDFGTEYSNFSIIDNVGYDIVKVDKIFIENIHQSELNQHLIKFCDDLFTKKDKVIVIEGVEKNSQVEYIKNTQSNKFYIQGYFYSKPIPLEQLIEFKI